MSGMAESDAEERDQSPSIGAEAKSTIQTGGAKTGRGLTATAPKGGKKAKPDKAAGKQRTASQAPVKKPAARDTAGSPSSVKKGKKKKVKEATFDVPRALPVDVDRSDRFLPTRAVMQRLVMRAATMKEKDKDGEPACQDVRPWEKY